MVNPSLDATPLFGGGGGGGGRGKDGLGLGGKGQALKRHRYVPLFIDKIYRTYSSSLLESLRTPG